MYETFIDGAPVLPSYQAAITHAIDNCCEAEIFFDPDELERHAEQKRKAEEDARRALETSRQSPRASER